MQELLVVGCSDGSSLRVLTGGMALFQRQASEAGGSLDFFLRIFLLALTVLNILNIGIYTGRAELRWELVRPGLCFRVFVSVFSKAGAGKKLAPVLYFTAP